MSEFTKVMTNECSLPRISAKGMSLFELRVRERILKHSHTPVLISGLVSRSRDLICLLKKKKKKNERKIRELRSTVESFGLVQSPAESRIDSDANDH